MIVRLLFTSIFGVDTLFTPGNTLPRMILLFGIVGRGAPGLEPGLLAGMVD